MALLLCPECKKEVSSKAAACPNCGAPIAKPKQSGAAGRGCAGAILLVFVIIVLGAIFGGKEEHKSTPEAQPQKSSAECREDLHCYAQQYFSSAGVYCRSPIEASAKYEMKWTDAWYEQKFSAATWLDKDAGTLTFQGNKAKFQNGFGAFRGVSYECDFDPKTNAVLGVRINHED